MTAPDVRGSTQVLGIFGDPLTYTLSPVFQNAGLRALGRDAVYVPFPVPAAAFSSLVEGLKNARNFLGGNVTHPHKRAALKLADKLTLEAKATGAVNTLFRQGRHWVGHNTDPQGFLLAATALSKKGIRGRKILVLGAGGAARAVALGCLKGRAAQIVLASRRPSQAVDSCRYLDHKSVVPSEISIGSLASQIENCDWLVNTVPDPQFSEKVGLILKGCKASLSVFDITYHPLFSPLLLAAKRKGYEHFHGIRMLLEQGILSFSIWTREKAPREIMEKALERSLKRIPVK